MTGGVVEAAAGAAAVLSPATYSTSLGTLWALRYTRGVMRDARTETLGNSCIRSLDRIGLCGRQVCSDCGRTVSRGEVTGGREM